LEKAKELFEREAGVLHRLHHPQLPGFWELFQADIGGGRGCLFLVQDYVEGQTYFDVLKSGQRLSEAEVTQLLCQMLPVLSYIHSQGVLHRDISPDNIIQRNSDPSPVLIDFGGVKQLAATAISKFTSIGVLQTRIGKKGYAPEEQLRQGQVFANSDLYSLAVTALVLLTGKEPQHLYDIHKGTWHWGREIKVSQPLEAVLKKMLAYKPSDRFANADEVLQAIPSQITLAPPEQANTNHSQAHTIATTPTPLPVAATSNPTPSRFSVNAIASRIHTLVVAPGKPKPAPIPIAQQANPAPLQRQANNPVIQKPRQLLNNFTWWLLKLSAGIGLVLVTGWAGWAVMSSVILSTPLGSIVKRSPNPPANTSPSSPEETRTEKILSRRQALGISEESFNERVNQQFYAKHPELKGRQLTAGAEDAALREEWYQIAEELLR
jgi:serine/threonine-protein kinase